MKRLALDVVQDLAYGWEKRNGSVVRWIFCTTPILEDRLYNGCLPIRRERAGVDGQVVEVRD